MIVPMKKIYIVTQAKDAVDVVTRLRGLGIVHIEHVVIPQGQAVTALSDDLALLTSARDILSRYEMPENAAQSIPHDNDWQHCAKHIVELQKRFDQLQEHSRMLAGKIAQWQKWGDFDPEHIAALAEKGIYVRLYQVPQREFPQVQARGVVRQAYSSGGFTYCVVVSRDKTALPHQEIALPGMGLSAMRVKLQQNAAHEQNIISDLGKQKAFSGFLSNVLEQKRKALIFQQTIAGLGQHAALSYVAGYVPVPQVEALRSEAVRHGWAFLAQDPGDDDAVPTLLRNPRWVQLVKPIFALLGVTPGYRELDVSLLFLVFFSIFFGILIGDAGYGLAYIVITILLQKKFGHKPEMKSTFILLYVLSSCAITWGVLTATFFGQQWLTGLGVKALVPQLNDTNTMQRFCFFLGALHLSIAHSWRTIVKLPSLSALSEVGWIGVLWAAFFMAKTLILADPFPEYGKWLVFGGVGLVIFFTNPQKNILKCVGEGLGTIALSLMNNFTDVVSYVRLFAVGLAGVAIAETTNGMANMGPGVFSMIAGILIAVFGHALNIVLGPMSVLVHGVRLNVLEFSGHVGVTWSGAEYDPLKE
jgi:V/A-type H+-transporting ATPase subunit I